MTSSIEALRSRLEKYHQTHALTWWDTLSTDQQASLSDQLDAVDFELLESVRSKASQESAREEQIVPRADVATAPQSLVAQPESESDRERWRLAAEQGAKMLAANEVAVLTVAGGQGSRLGFDHPKGMFPVGPASDRTLFQIFAEQILARRRQYDCSIPWLIMTSSATHEETVRFLSEQNYFGLPADTVHLFQQGSMPAVDQNSGRLLMKAHDELCLSPDGHGGLITALKSSGLLGQMKDAGVEQFFYHQVDNPTVIMCDPALLGLHAEAGSQLTTNVVRKVTPTEKMGVLADVNGRLEIIEYSELNEEQAHRKDENGDDVFWAGNTAIHVFARRFFEELTAEGCRLELHLASKKVPHINEAGESVVPSEPNAFKFERFIFDALPLAHATLVVEGNREREFNPVKNAEGNDSPATSRSALTRIYREWLSAAGQTVDDARTPEISPLVAQDAVELSARLSSGAVSLDDLLR